ncbi:MAG: beta-phosphoglucomutase family hydrolase [Frankiaceae bacterium]|nr:beta-phosphoglucomutase family hydrolase [Frankiaceae bacterium]
MPIGLPAGITACLFDLDGVLTDTASAHAAAWKEAFDGLLRARASQPGRRDEGFEPFSIERDYPRYVDGTPRADGVRDFLASRGITLPEGSAKDSERALTVAGIGNRKNAALLRRLKDDGVAVYAGSRAYLEAARDAGLRRAVVSSSANTAQILRVTGLEALVELRVDGLTILKERLAGKPAPDTFLRAAAQLGVPPAEAAVFEDALSGVAAGAAGGFGIVVGVNRLDAAHAKGLADQGADVVVSDLSALLGSSAQ